MSGPTLTAAAVDSSSFHRSNSSPDLLSQLAKPPRSLSHHQNLSFKSLPSLPAFDVPSFDTDPDFRTTLVRGSLSAKEKKTLPTRPQGKPAPTPGPPQASNETLARRKSLIDRPRSWIPSSKSSPNVRELILDETAAAPKGHGPTRDLSSSTMVEPRLPDRTRTVSESFADFARRSWISSSRSPSPVGRSPAVAEGRDRSDSGGSPTPGSQPRKRLGPDAADEGGRPSSDSPSSTTRALSRASVYLTRIKQRPQSVFVRSSSPKPDTVGTSVDGRASPPVRTLPVPLPSSGVSRNASQTAVSNDGSDDGIHGGPAASALDLAVPPAAAAADASPSLKPLSSQRDPLWAAFRELDGNSARFAAKNTTGQRMSLVRTTLIPFLRRYAYDSSNHETKRLAPDLVERRAVILDRWWNGMLDMLGGGAGTGSGANLAGTGLVQSVAGIDRPALLDATTMIMVRPEWRLNTTAFRPLVDRAPGEKVRARSNTADSTMFGATTSAFLRESAELNVRTMFVANLLRQMSLVVDKMSLRHAPLSLVNFAGKACAFAFFFVPGVADILVRLWGLERNADAIRRVADALGLPRRSKGESEDIVALFPPNLGPLGWSSVTTMALKLKRQAKLDVKIAGIAWYGPWISKWRGGDTDLLFIFCKYFFILADEFMPSELPLVEKARSPAFVLLLAQLLSILDKTIHRQAAVEAMLGPLLPDGADSLPPLLPNNLLRGMDENRMIILLKDFLFSDDTISGARHTFAEAFVALLEAATRKTSQYDHNACYMLCDFLEQSLLTLDGYYGYTASAAEDDESASCPPTDYVNWPFWMDVFQRILASNNTMSEIRMLSFVFSVWDIIAADPSRKEELCLNWLLTEDTFEKFFNNWCPMVRAYYMRLLCWRICRDAGSANELDARIFCLVSQRLKKVWSHYLWLKQKAGYEGAALPSTAPALPQPGKRFMIVRSEIGMPQPGLFSTFDATPGSFGHQGLGGNDYHSGLSGAGSAEDRRADGSSTAKRRWSLLGKVLSLTSGSGTTPASAGSPVKPTYEEQFEQARRDLAASRSAARHTSLQNSPSSTPPPPPPKPSQSQAVAPSSDSDSSTGSAPIFDAAQFVFRFVLHNVPWQGGPQGFVPPLFRDKILTRPRLPAPAQARVSARAASTGGRSESPPPPAPGLPPPTRRVSGLLMTGLVSGAKNANPAESVPAEESSNASKSTRSRNSSQDSVALERRLEGVRGRDASVDSERERPLVQPMEPRGAAARTSKYAGRALAEWGMVVNECNSFVERRRDEGVLGLKEVEVPTLGVEGLRRLV